MEMRRTPVWMTEPVKRRTIWMTDKDWTELERGAQDRGMNPSQLVRALLPDVAGVPEYRVDLDTGQVTPTKAAPRAILNDILAGRPFTPAPKPGKRG